MNLTDTVSMTPMEAWSIVAPILAAHMERIPRDGGLDALDEAYVIVFGALRKEQERREVETK